MKIREYLLIAILAGLLGVSIFFLDASKFDTAQKVWLSLVTGVLAIAPIILVPRAIVRFRTGANLLLLAWLVLVWISFYYSETQNFGFTECILYTFAALACIATAGISRKSQKILVGMILFIGIASALYGFWFFPTHIETRMAGLFRNLKNNINFFPNAFSDYILLAWPLALAFFKKNTSSLHACRKIFTAIILSILLSALYLTFSRGAWLVFVIQVFGFALYFITNAKAHYHGKKLSIVIGIIATLALTIVFTSGLTTLRSKNFETVNVIQKINFEGTEKITSLEERKDFMTGSLKLALERPLTGFGPMSFRYVYPRVQKLLLGIADHSHNFILKTAVESGIPAAIILGLLILFAFILTLKNLSKDIFSFGVGVGVSGILLHNMVDFNLNFTNNLLALFIALGILLSANNENSVDAQKSGLTKKAIFVLWLFISLGVTSLSISEIDTTYKIHKNPQNYDAYSASLISRDFFRDEANKLLLAGGDKNRTEAMKLLEIHLRKNPLDAAAWYLTGKFDRALELDPVNQFSYYRAAIENAKTITPELRHTIVTMLMLYEPLLDQNLHYTAFTTNPDQAAQIYALLGEPEKADSIREKADKIRRDFMAKTAVRSIDLFSPKADN